MSTDKIDFDAHKALSRQFGFKLSASLLWRDLVFQFMPTLIASLFVLFLVKDFGSNQIVVFIAWSMVIYIGFVVLTNQYILKALTRARFKEFSVHLVKDDQIEDSMGFYDCLCVRISLFWRQLVLGLAYGVLSMGIEHFNLLPETVMGSLDRGMQVVTWMVATYWMLVTKKNGRRFILQSPQAS